ncbi:hypothetical protein J2T02_004333 [Chitinophaga terrae (ex Kim and Jung 2007)]|nr:hypothetical protein [Chitinophaga terrae (ex Kim and Jung 2007)]
MYKQTAAMDKMSLSRYISFNNPEIYNLKQYHH